MNNEEEKLLIKDLSARLTYGVIVSVTDINNFQFDGKLKVIGENWCRLDILDSVKKARVKNPTIPIRYVCPYLRPISSMTDEEFDKYEQLEWAGDFEHLSLPLLDWLNKKMFDYRDLIKRGLALEAPEGMYD